MSRTLALLPRQTPARPLTSSTPVATQAIMGVAFNHIIPGALPGCMYN